MLGVCLLFVGIVLINNGVCSLANVDRKSAAVMNILTGDFHCLSILLTLYREIIMRLVQGFCFVLPICL